MQLHIISQSPYQNDAFAQAMKIATAQDKVLFIDDGVYALTGAYLQQIQQHPCQCFAIKEHVALRGLKPDLSLVKLITFGIFVDLSLEAQHCLSWY